MHKTAYRYRIYPTEEQEKTLLRMIEAGRKLWNDALAHRKWRWEKHRKSTSYEDQAWILTAERKNNPELGELYSQSAQDILRRLDKAFNAFFKGIARYPRFKPFRNSGSFSYPQAYNGSVKLNGRTVSLSKVGDVPIVVHRELPMNGKVKTCTIESEPCGEWYAVLTYDIEGQTPTPIERISSPVGVDLGLKSLIATTDGQKIPHPQYLRNAEKRLKRLQRELSRKQRGSKNREKSRRLLAVQHAKVSRQRLDFNHKVSTNLVSAHNLLAFEDLKVRNMVRNHSLAKSIQDAGWEQLIRFSEYKAERVGKLLVKVPPAYSTQECCFCGAINNIGLEVREFVCVGCGRKLDRDLNASGIVLKRGLAQVGQGMPELTPVEIAPPLLKSDLGASAVMEAGTIGGGPP